MYNAWVFIHLAGVFGFLLAHGVSVSVLFRLQKERNPERVNDLIALSGSSIRMFYVSLGVLVAGGIVAGFVGLLLILYLMVFKPTLGFGGIAAVPGPSASACVPDGASLMIRAQPSLAFDRACLAAPASQPFTIAFDNQENGVIHNVAIYTNSGAGTALFRGALVTGPKTVTYRVGALVPGTYFFRCDVHPTKMTGRFIVGAVSPSATPTASPSS